MKSQKIELLKDLQSQDQSKLYSVINDVVPNNVLARKNKSHSWKAGYNEKYDIVVISKDGTVGQIYDINGVKIALPSTPKLKSTLSSENQYWKATEYPKELKRISSIFKSRRCIMPLKNT